MIRRWLIAAGLCTMTILPGVRAQETQPAQDETARRVEREMERLRRDLELSDAQAEKIQAILTETLGKRSEVEKEQDSRIGEVLTPEQKERYTRNRERGQRGDRGGFGGRGGMMTGILDRMKTDLALTEEQSKQVEEIMTKAQEEMAENFRKMREEGMGNQDWNAIRERMTEFWNASAEKVKAVLSDDQKAKYDAMVAEMREQNPLFRGEGRGPGRGDGEGQGRGDRGDGRRVERALETLKLSPEEAEIVRPLLEEIEKIRNDRGAVEEARRKLLETLDSGSAAEETVQAELQALRDAETARQAALTSKRTELRELLTVEQEARLVTMGILD